MAHLVGARQDRVELRFVTQDGRVRRGLVSLAVTVGDGPRRAVLRIENLQAYKDLEDALARQSTHDPVSGLPNRGLFLERVRRAAAMCEDDVPAAVLVLEVDGLRDLIDREGFASGDSMLAQVAHRLNAHAQAGVTVASLQPGVFAALLPGGGHDAARLADRFIASVSVPLELAGGTLTLRVSIGISTAAAGTQNSLSGTGRLVQDAENAARLGRDEGGNVVVFAAPEMRQAQQRQHELEALIRHALDRDQVALAYQPVFDLSSGLVVSAEALLRLTDPDGHPIPPLDVVSAAEASRLIVELGGRILQLAAVAGPEVVDRQVDAVVAQHQELVHARGAALEQDRFGELQGHRLRRHPGQLQGRQHVSTSAVNVLLDSCTAETLTATRTTTPWS